MKTIYLFIYSLLMLVFFSCSSNYDELIVEQGQAKSRCSEEELNSSFLKICDDYSYSNYPNYDSFVFKAYTPASFFGYWQLQYCSKNGKWEFIQGSQYDYGIFAAGDNYTSFQTRKSYYEYGNVHFRARKVAHFSYAQEVNPIPGYVTDWTPICTVHNNYMKEAGGLITNSYITVVIDFIFRTNDYRAKRIGKKTYELGFNALLEGKSSMNIPGPTEDTSTYHTYRYVYSVDKGDYSSNDDFNFHLRNLSPYEMFWNDVTLTAKVNEIQNVIFRTVEVNVSEHDKDDYKYDEFGFE